VGVRVLQGRDIHADLGEESGGVLTEGAKS
jgi:hypothetical protein